MGGRAKTFGDLQKLGDDIKKLFGQAEAIGKKKHRDFVDDRAQRLNRSLDGRLPKGDRASFKNKLKVVKILHRDKTLNLPKGTTQKQAEQIIIAIMAGDQNAIRQYTKPKGRR